jgi:protein-S-isoprenylcysteine O-methyltransferase Ste14
MHQIYVWFCWRTQLHYSLITRLFGRSGFTYYSIIFAILAISRFIAVLFLAISNKNSFNVNPIVSYGLSLVFGLLVLYVLYSIVRYFTFRRALGVDHFDVSYRNAGLVTKGIFRFTRNPMYIFALLILWIPGLLLSSEAALTVALFSHIYIWIHYFCTEKPDMKQIYGHLKDA